VSFLKSKKEEVEDFNKSLEQCGKFVKLGGSFFVEVPKVFSDVFQLDEQSVKRKPNVVWIFSRGPGWKKLRAEVID